MNETLLLTCPRCSGVNRVLADKLRKAPTCGRCSTSLLPAMPMEPDPAALARMIARDGLPLLVDFWSASCGPCRMMAPAFAEASRLLAPAVRTAKVRTDEHQGLAAAHGIRAVPTMILFDAGREADRVSGAMDARTIVEWARSRLAGR